MNKKLILICSIGVFFIVLLLIFMISKSSKKKENTVSAPTISMNEEISLEDMIKLQNKNAENTENTIKNNEAEKVSTDPKEIITEEDIQKAILSNTSSTVTTSNSEKEHNQSNNNKYKYTNLYEDPTIKHQANEAKEPISTTYNKIEYLKNKKENLPPKKREKKQYWNVKSAYRNQKIYEGSILSFILMEDAKNLEDSIVPKGTILSGLVNIRNNRIYVHFTSVSINYEIFPLNFTLCNVQGIEGIGIISNEKNTNTKINNVTNEIVSSIPVIGGIVNSTINNTTTNKSENYKLPDSFRAKITTIDNEY